MQERYQPQEVHRDQIREEAAEIAGQAPPASAELRDRLRLIFKALAPERQTPAA